LKYPLILATDVYGGRGGIALYNKHLINALCHNKKIKKITVIPRKIFYKIEKIPQKVSFKENTTNSNFNYLFCLFKFFFKKNKYDIIFCCHIHLLPFAWLLSIKYKCPLVLTIYGEEAWKPTKYKFANLLCRKINFLITIRHYTAKKFVKWSKFRINKNNFFYLPNCVDDNKYGLKLKNKKLIKKYNLEKKNIIISCGRLDMEDKYKGVDEIIEILKDLSKKVKNLIYIVIGDGDDKNRLEEKAKFLKVDHSIIFTGRLSEKEKIDYFQLGKLLAMPGSRKGFDRYPYRFVFLEGLASGMQVICSNLKYQPERDDPNVKMLIQVNSFDGFDIINKIVKAIKKKKYIHPLLKNFYFSSFTNKFEKICNIIDNKAQILK
jgi:glycosyltransferase involved in cell wall biosynthesis